MSADARPEVRQPVAAVESVRYQMLRRGATEAQPSPELQAGELAHQRGAHTAETDRAFQPRHGQSVPPQRVLVLEIGEVRRQHEDVGVVLDLRQRDRLDGIERPLHVELLEPRDLQSPKLAAIADSFPARKVENHVIHKGNPHILKVASRRDRPSSRKIGKNVRKRVRHMEGVHVSNWHDSFRQGFDDKVSGEKNAEDQDARRASSKFRRTRTTVGILVAIVAVLLLAAGGLFAGQRLTGVDPTHPHATSTPAPGDPSTAP